MQGSKEGGAETESREGSHSPGAQEGGEENSQEPQAAGDAASPLSDGTATPGEELVTSSCFWGLFVQGLLFGVGGRGRGATMANRTDLYKVQ